MTNDKRLQAAPLGRPPGFKDPVTLPPFTAERRLRDAAVKVKEHYRISMAELLRRAVKIGLATMIQDIKAERQQRDALSGEGVER